MTRILSACLTLVLGACASPRALPSTSAPTDTTADTTAAAETTSSADGVVTAADPGEGGSQRIGNPGLGCDGAVVFEHPPVDLESVEYLVPFGLMTGSHVTPVDHQYFQNFVEPERRIDVYAPGSGRVVSLQHFGAPVSEDPDGVVDDFRLVIEHTCSVSSIFIHVDELIPRLAAHDPGIGNQTRLDVSVAAGERIGSFTQNVDYNVVDLDHTVAGLVDSDTYEREPWKVHVPDTFDYFTVDIGARMAALSLRTEEPRGGRFDYDVDGRLVGNWFAEGTGGYGGSDPERYWSGHLAFAYDHLDPDTVVVSIGTFDGRSRQFAVSGNGPDPADVSVESGLVLYDLVEWDYYTAGGERWDRRTFASGIEARPGSAVMGVIAVRMIADREMLVEILPGASSGEFSGFGDAAAVYTR